MNNRRAWNGKLQKIDELLMWMYDKDVLNKGEKAQKDSLFHKYYRYYNDGDYPRGMKYKGKNYIEKNLEDSLDAFIKKILTKYMRNISRKEFRRNMFEEKTEFLIKLTKDQDYYSLCNYWVKDCKDKKIVEMIKDLKKEYNIVNEMLQVHLVNNNLSQHKNMVMSYALGKLEEGIGSIPKDLAFGIDGLELSMKKIEIALKTLLRKKDNL